jgi:hypothetical protein
MTESITIRQTRATDAKALRRLAELDGRHAPERPALAAYADGELVAAVGVKDGRVVADPFRYTSDVVSMLSVRAEQERGGGRGHLLRWVALGHRVGREGMAA